MSTPLPVLGQVLRPGLTPSLSAFDVILYQAPQSKWNKAGDPLPILICKMG